MNKAYRVIWNETTGMWMAVSELARGRGKLNRSVVSDDRASVEAAIGVSTVPANVSGRDDWASDVRKYMMALVTVLGGMSGGEALAATAPCDNNAKVNNSYNALSCGTNAAAQYAGDVALGTNVTANSSGQGYSAIAIGADVAATNAGIGIGSSVKASGANSVVLGHNSTATQANSVALGSNSTADRGPITTVTDPLSYNKSTVTTSSGEVSVGSSTNKRQITNVAAGTQATDAANVSQVSAVKTVVDTNASRVATALGGGSTVGSDGTISLPSYTIGGTPFTSVGGALGNLDVRLSTLNGLAATYTDTTKATLSLGGASGTKVTNLQDATLSTTSRDAVTGRQLNTTNTNVTNLTNTVSGIDTRLTTAEDNIGGLETRVTTNNAAVGAAQSQLNTLDGVAAKYDDTSKGTMTLGGANGTKVTNLQDATLSATSTDAVTGRQLNTTNTNVTNLTNTVSGIGTRVTTAEGDISDLDTRVTVNNTAIGTTQSQLNTLDGVAAKYDDATKGTMTLSGANGTKVTNLQDATLSATSTDAVTGRQLNTTNTNVTNLTNTVSGIDTRVTTAEGNIDSLTSQITNISSGTAGLVQQDATTKNLTVGKNAGGAEVSFAGQDADGNATKRKLTDIADGTNANDAVNYGQLSTVKTGVDQNTQDIATNATNIATNTASIAANAKATADALGGGAAVGADGTVTAPSYTAGGTTFNSVGGALSNLDGRVTQNTADVEKNTSDISNLSSQINSGTAGLVQQDATTKNLTVGKSVGGTEVSFAGQDADGNATKRKLTDVADGANANDAVNFGQLSSVKTTVDQNTTNIGTLNTTVSGIDTRVTTAEDNISGLDTRATTNKTAIDAAQSQLNTLDGVAAKYDDATKGAMTLGGANGTKVTNLQDATLSATSTDAVTGRQLNNTNTNVTTLTNTVSGIDTRVTTAEDSISDLDTRVTTNQTAIDAAQSQLNTLDGVAAKYDDATKGAMTLGGTNGTKLTNLQDATLSATSTDAVTGRQLNATNTRMTTAEGNIDTLKTRLSSISGGTAGLVQQDATTKNLSVGKDTGGTEVSFAGQDSDGNATKRKLTDVADGTNANDAVNFGQLSSVKATADQNTTDIGTLNTTVSGIDSRVKTAEGSISDLDTRVTANKTAVGEAQSQLDALDGVAAKYDDTTKGTMTLGGANGTKVTNLQDATLSESSTDAVTGRQLNTTNTNVTNLTNTVNGIDARVITAEGNIDNLKSQVTSISSGTAGLVQQDDSTKNLTVGKSTGGTEVSFAGQDADGNATKRKLTDVADGTNANDAVNYGQLSSVKATADQNTTNITANTTSIAANAKATADALGGGATVGADGTVTAPNYAVGGKSFNNVGGALGNLDGRVTTNTTDIADLKSSITDGSVGLVQQDPESEDINVAATKGGNKVNFAGTDGDRVLAGVADGEVSATSNQAVNGKQLYSTGSGIADALGGGAGVNADGTFRAPTYTIGGAQQNNVGDALKNLDDRVAKNTSDIAGNTNAINQINGGDGGGGLTKNSVQYDTDDHTSVTMGSSDAGAVSVKNVKNGNVAQNSTDAVNGGQLWDTNQMIQNLDQKVTNNQTTGNSNVSVKSSNPTIASASGNASVAIGGGAQASGAQSTALGENAVASGTNSVALGQGSVADEDGTVSVGSSTSQRRITNVAIGQNPTDAVNYGQLNQLRSDMNNSINQVAKAAYGGIAAAMAMPNMMPSGPGRTVVAAGAANYKGYNAVAAGVTYRSRSGNLLVNGALSMTQSGEAGVRAQVGYDF
ncbi:ESPR-type extended signal peptide-containing protein [Trinickia sp. YCB016]